MTEPGPSGIIVGDAVEWWLQKEAGTSTVDRNKELDDLEAARLQLIYRNDPKIDGHITRMQKWLSLYASPELSPVQTGVLETQVAFGALMFLSGTYRRQRYLQSTDQNDYFQRKLEWKHPRGINASAFMLDVLAATEGEEVSAHDVIIQGSAALQTTEESIKVIYARMPRDFGKEGSESVDEIQKEQAAWLTFFSRVIRRSSFVNSIPMEEVPILEPRSITDTKPTTLKAVLATKQAAR